VFVASGVPGVGEADGGAGVGVGEADGGPGVGVGEAGQIFTGTSPVGAQGAAAAGKARTSGEAASTRTAADVQQAFRVEFILPIVVFNRLSAGNPGPAHRKFEQRASALVRCWTLAPHEADSQPQQPD